MQQNIESIVKEVLRELEALGLKKSTVDQYRRGLFSPIIRHFVNDNGGIYDSQTLESCHAKYQSAIDSGGIKRHHYQSMIRSLAHIKSYAETGSVSFSRLVNTKQFIPGEEAVSIIENALAKTDLKSDFKYKLNCVLRKFFCFLEEKGLSASDLTVELIREFIVHASAKNAGSMGYVMQSLKILINFLRDEDIANVCADINYFKPKSAPKRIVAAFTEQEVLAMLSKIDLSLPIGKRDYAIILLACGTGLRGIDIVNLKLSDVDWKCGEIRIVQSKTGKPITLPINGQIRNVIADYILNGRPQSASQNIFLRSIVPFTALKGASSLDSIVDNLCIKANVPKQLYRSFHSLRRSFGTWLAKEEVPIDTIFQLLGHQRADSSKPYLSFNDKQMFGCALGFLDIPLKGGVYA